MGIWQSLPLASSDSEEIGKDLQWSKCECLIMLGQCVCVKFLYLSFPGFYGPRLLAYRHLSWRIANSSFCVVHNVHNKHTKFPHCSGNWWHSTRVCAAYLIPAYFYVWLSFLYSLVTLLNSSPSIFFIKVVHCFSILLWRIAMDQLSVTSFISFQVFTWFLTERQKEWRDLLYLLKVHIAGQKWGPVVKSLEPIESW